MKKPLHFLTALLLLILFILIIPKLMPYVETIYNNPNQIVITRITNRQDEEIVPIIIKDQSKVSKIYRIARTRPSQNYAGGCQIGSDNYDIKFFHDIKLILHLEIISGCHRFYEKLDDGKVKSIYIIDESLRNVFRDFIELESAN